MKKINGLTVVLFVSVISYSQDLTKFRLYHPESDAKQDIASAVKEARQSGKFVFIEIGGNWCIWCARFNKMITHDLSIDSLIKKNYMVYHLNFSKENQNKELLGQYKFPQRFGFPVFLILNKEGELIHTQNSSYLESGNGYDKEKVIAFFTDWSPSALDPEEYK